MNGDQLPDRRRHGYKELEEKLEEHAHEMEDRLRKFFTKALIAFAIVGVTSAGSLLGFGILLKVIQNQRYDASYQNCRQQNIRHDEAVAEARKVFPKRTQKGVVDVLDKLQPYIDDCAKQAKSRVRGDRDAQ